MIQPHETATFRELTGFIWQVADLLRGDYKQADYGKVILPLTVLRRLDCVLEPTKTAVLERAAQMQGAAPALREEACCARALERCRGAHECSRTEPDCVTPVHVCLLVSLEF